jgi:hypothetical protein
MGEWIGASIQFGGRLKEEKVDELIELLQDKRLLADWCDQPERGNLHLTFASGDVNYGNLDELEDFGAENGLFYRYWHDSGPEWASATYVYTPHDRQRRHAMGDANSELSLNETQIRELGTYAAVLEYFSTLKADLPDLEIVP